MERQAFQQAMIAARTAGKRMASLELKKPVFDMIFIRNRERCRQEEKGFGGVRIINGLVDDLELFYCQTEEGVVFASDDINKAYAFERWPFGARMESIRETLEAFIEEIKNDLRSGTIEGL